MSVLQCGLCRLHVYFLTFLIPENPNAGISDLIPKSKNLPTSVFNLNSFKDSKCCKIKNTLNNKQFFEILEFQTGSVKIVNFKASHLAINNYFAKQTFEPPENTYKCFMLLIFCFTLKVSSHLFLFQSQFCSCFTLYRFYKQYTCFDSWKIITI